MADLVKFPTVRSGVLFGSYGPAERNAYFDALASCDPLDVEPQAFYGHNGWNRMTAGVDKSAATEEFLGRYATSTFEERRDWAYGNALHRFMGPAASTLVRDTVMADERDGIGGLGGGRGDAFRDAAAAQFDPDAATSALFKSLFGGGI